MSLNFKFYFQECCHRNYQFYIVNIVIDKGMAGLGGFISDLWSYLALPIVVILTVSGIICVENDLSLPGDEIWNVSVNFIFISILIMKLKYLYFWKKRETPILSCSLDEDREIWLLWQKYFLFIRVSPHVVCKWFGYTCKHIVVKYMALGWSQCFWMWL